MTLEFPTIADAHVDAGFPTQNFGSSTVLRADAKLPYGQMREIFARAQKVGFPGIALMVGERHQAKES